MKITNTELKKYQKFSIETAIFAGKILLKFEKKISQVQVHHKKAQGIASSADIASEKFILKEIKKCFPTHNILGEETCYSEGVTDFKSYCEKGFTWIVDPLDGTNNFLNGLNYYAICIALCFNGVPIVGVVYRPSTNEIFYAAKNCGAFYQVFPKTKKMKMYSAKNPKNMKESIFATGFATEKGERISEEFLPFKTILTNSRAVRRMGSAALDMCYMAKGVFDGFWERHLAPWDVAASGIICLEAGAKVTDFLGQPFTPFDRTILVSREPLYGQIKNLIEKN